MERNDQIISCFKKYAYEITNKTDKAERIFRISRNIRIESKRIIELLHRYNNEENDILSQAKDRFDGLFKTEFKNLAKELYNEDVYQFTSGLYSDGIQEFVEAITFYNYMQNGCLLQRSDIITMIASYVPSDNSCVSDNLCIAEKMVPYLDYVLGFLDLPGELMKYSVNHTATSDNKLVLSMLSFVREIGMVGNHVLFYNRSYISKMAVLYNSLNKIGNACTSIAIRRLSNYKIQTCRPDHT